MELRLYFNGRVTICSSKLLYSDRLPSVQCHMNVVNPISFQFQLQNIILYYMQHPVLHITPPKQRTCNHIFKKNINKLTSDKRVVSTLVRPTRCRRSGFKPLAAHVGQNLSIPSIICTLYSSKSLLHQETARTSDLAT